MIELYGIRVCELPALRQAEALSLYAAPWRAAHASAKEDVEAQKSLGGLLLLEASGAKGELRYTEAGRPYLAGGAVDFSISHTREHVFCAIAAPSEGQRAPRVGLDAEELFRAEQLDGSRLAARWFTDAEQALFARDRSGEAFLRIWTRKEALVKYTGEGLAGMRAADTADVSLERTFYDYTADGAVLALCVEDGACAPQNVTLLDGNALLCRLAAQNRAWKE